MRNKAEVSERGPEAGVRRQRRLQLDHMFLFSLYIPSQQNNLAALSIEKYVLKCVAAQVTFSSLRDG